GDYNDDNHVGALSDVSPNYQHDLYDIQIVTASGPRVHVTMSRAEVTKEIALVTGRSYFDVVYRVGPATHWVQSGFSPSLVNLIWNAEMDRVWPISHAGYMGQRNPNTGIATAWVNGGGAEHQKEFSGTLMKGDEIKGNGVFQCGLFAGLTSAPDPSGEIAELEAVFAMVTDTIGPAPTTAEYYPTVDRLRLNFDQECDPVSVNPYNIGLDEDGDGLAEVTLDAGATLLETEASFVLTFALDLGTAAAVEALDPTHIVLLLEADAVRDTHLNGNLEVTEIDDVTVPFVQTQITVDGRFESGEWLYGYSLPDSNDSAWTAANEIDGLYASWDSVYLYLGLDGVVSNNSWLIYLDVDPDSLTGEIDLMAIDAWERGASFSATGFRADFQYGCYQHQSAYDGDGFWQILSPTTSQDRSGEILSAFDSYHIHGDAGGSELAIPWHTLYGLGNNAVPPGARLSIVAAICWDPEPDGELGGDSAPNNLTAGLPEIDTVWTLDLDGNGDGIPDVLHLSPVPSVPAADLQLFPAYPNPFNPSTTIEFEIPTAGVSQVSVAVYDLQGRLISMLLEERLPTGRHSVVWNGQDDSGRLVAAGTYICCLRYRGLVKARPLSLIK
ncbi:MAG: FlgD immunoglobulin-like domain containing protein, partial [bacterium]